jgi:hypothetical protein
MERSTFTVDRRGLPSEAVSGRDESRPLPSTQGEARPSPVEMNLDRSHRLKARPSPVEMNLDRYKNSV